MVICKSKGAKYFMIFSKTRYKSIKTKLFKSLNIFVIIICMSVQAVSVSSAEPPSPAITTAYLPRIAAGFNHTAVVKNDGTVWTWGDNSHGQLGIGTLYEKASPVQVKFIANAVSVAAGYYHTAALKKDGTVWCWGDNENGQLGDATTEERLYPVRVKGLTGITAIAAGSFHTVALKNDGTVWVWGYNNYKQLGTSVDKSVMASSTPVQVKELSCISRIETDSFGCTAFKQDGTVWVWGDIRAIGGNNTVSAVPVEIKEPDNVVGLNNNLIVTKDGTVYARDIDFNLRQNPEVIKLGNGFYKLNYLADVKKIAGTDLTGVFLKNDGTVWRWRTKKPEKITPGDKYFDLIIVEKITGLSKITDIYSSGHLVALSEDGSIWCAGSNSYGQLGTGSPSNSTVPVQVKGLIDIDFICAGGVHSAAVKSDGTIWTWGSNMSGQIGNGKSGPGEIETVPVRVKGLTGVIKAAATGTNTLALKKDGTVWQWGWKHKGYSIDGNINPNPTKIEGLSDVSDMTSGTGSTLFLRKDGTVWQCPSMLFEDKDKPPFKPVEIKGLSGVIAVASGARHILALKKDGTVWAWGDNTAGQLGDGSLVQWGNIDQFSKKPVRVSGIGNIIKIASKENVSFAIQKDGTVWTWGGKTAYSGVLVPSPNDVKTYKTIPVKIDMLKGITSIAAGERHYAALASSGAVYCWGDNDSGQLGGGTRTDKTTPVKVVGLYNVKAVSMGIAYTLALKKDGTVWTWGNNRYGQLGNGNVYKADPVKVDGIKAF